ncbi:MAG: hypothetical protein ACYDHC_09040 [Desulfuromonadaceae bacterium]
MQLNKNVEISMSNGMLFRFEDEGNKIIYKCSSFTGKESVEVNRRIVSEANNFKTRSEHSFTTKGIAYSISLVAKNIFKGNIECSFRKNSTMLKRYNLKYIKPDNLSGKYIASIIALGAVGIVMGAKLIPWWVGILIMATHFIATVKGFKGNWICEEEFV